jgi:hypothetical protein
LGGVEGESGAAPKTVVAGGRRGKRHMRWRMDAGALRTAVVSHIPVVVRVGARGEQGEW